MHVGLKLLANFLATCFHHLLGEVVDVVLFLTRLLVLHGLHGGLRDVLTNIYTVIGHGRLCLRHGDGGDLHGPLELSIGEGRVELLWGALSHGVGAQLGHHVHLARVHGVHRVAKVAEGALHALQLLLARVCHDAEFVLNLLDIVVLGLGVDKRLCLKLERRAHGFDL